MSAPRIFLSHSHKDNDFCRRLVTDLRGAGADVWYDEHNLGWGELRREIDRELPARPFFLVILSPDAVTSDWVNREIDAALDLLRTGDVRVFLPIVARACAIPPTLRGYRRVEFTAGDANARAALLHALGLAAPATDAAPAPSQPTAPPMAPALVGAIAPEHFPARLKDLGFTSRRMGDVGVIVPPVCEVPAGTFLMGSDKRHDSQALPDEQPQHPVTLGDYRIGRYSVTVAEYACYVRAGGTQPSRSRSGVDWQKQLGCLDHPVVCISWHDAVAYAAWLAKLTGRPWRLPSEAEWEKAARGTEGRIYPWGDQWDKARANTREGGPGTTTPVGAYVDRGDASPYGAHDQAGNVWEWTGSSFQRYPYTPNGVREEPKSTWARVLRGGSWIDFANPARAAFRYLYSPNYFNDGFGFRLAWSVAAGS